MASQPGPSDMDLALLRELVGGVVAGLTAYTHKELGGACVALGLPEPPGASEGSKRQRVDCSFAGLPDDGLPLVAERILMSELPVPLDAGKRNAIQDVLWSGQGAIEMPKRTRRETAQDLDLEHLALKPDRFMALLDRLWVLDTPFDPWTDGASSLRTRIDRHVFRNPATGPPRACSRSSERSRQATRGSGSSWRGWPPPASSPTSRRNGASPPP